MCNYRSYSYDQIIIVVPARGGSKRVPHKNIYPLNGKPLILYTLQAIFEASLGCPVYISTEDKQIARVVNDFKFGDVIDRPFELAKDSASTESVLLHVLDKKKLNNFEWIMTLPPTSPFRKPDSIRYFAEYVLSNPDNQDCLMSVTENRGDFWQKNIDGTMSRLFYNAPRRQQDRSPLYEENSAIYVTKISALRKTHSILGNVVRSKVLSAREAFDINTIYDIKLAEFIEKNNYSFQSY